MFSHHFNHLISKTFGLALLALVSACGGGGGGGPALPFEHISQDGVAAVRDNTTGLVWAAQPAAVNEENRESLPSVQELLTLTDAGKEVIEENFPLVLNQEIQSRESEMNRPWLVSFSPGNLGEVRDGEPYKAVPFSSLKVLDRTKYTPPNFNRSKFSNNVALQGNLMWLLCTHGTKYDPINDVCEGVPEALEFNQAKDFASNLPKGTYGYSGWRLPTKHELQKMLSLNNPQDSLLAAPFNSVERKSLSNWSAQNPLEYWTSTEAPVENPDPTDPVVWVVNFDLGQDPGGVNTTKVSNVLALVRLVRDVR